MKGFIVMDPAGCRQLYGMGEGSAALSLLGVTAPNVDWWWELRHVASSEKKGA